jgi:hypothetical protein
VFEVNPLIHDKNIEKEVKRIEKARIEKKITDIQKKKGTINLKQFKNLDALLIEEDLPHWDFSLEKRTYKDTIETLHSFDRRTKSNVTRTDFNKTMKFKASTRVEPLLNIEVNIDDSNRVQKLQIFPHDDAGVVVENFCKRYGKNLILNILGLSEDKKIRLQKIIDEKLNENIGSTSNRS